MTGDSIFQEKVGQYGIQNNNVLSAFADLFSDRTACFFTELPQSRYVHKLHKNRDNYGISLAFIDANNKNNNNEAGNNNNNKTSNDNSGKPPDNNPNKLYEVYN